MTGQTQRRHSPAVYRRRRLVLLVLVVIVVALVVWLIAAQPWRGEASERPSPKPTASATATASASPADTPTDPAASAPAADATTAPPVDPTETPAPESTPLATPVADTCTAGDVTVDAVTDQSVYPSGQLPQLSIRLTNNSSTDCTMNVGTTSQSLTVTSGSDTWWRSTDCQTEPSDMIVLIAAGQTVTSAQPVPWDRTRSSVSTCGSERQRAPGGGASYHLKVSIGGITSARTAQFLMY